MQMSMELCVPGKRRCKRRAQTMNETTHSTAGSDSRAEDRKQGSRQPIASVASLGKTPRVPQGPRDERERAKKRAPAERRTAQELERAQRYAVGDEARRRHRRRMPQKSDTR